MSGIGRLLTGPRTIGYGTVKLRLLSAWQLLQAQQEAQQLAQNQESLDLCRNACLVARAAYRRNRRCFRDGKQVLHALSSEQIAAMAQRYLDLCRQSDFAAAADRAQLLAEGRQDAMERLRWKILKCFGVLPSEARAREMTGGDLLYCALQLALDQEETLAGLCPDCRAAAQTPHCTACAAPMPEENPKFDPQRFEELRHGCN